MQTGLFTYLAHPDFIKFVGEESVFNKHMRRLCEGMKAMEVPLELNLLGVLENRRYPNLRFWKIAQEVGNVAILGVDAHAPEQLLRTDTVEKAKKIAAEFGLPLIDRDLPGR